MSIHNNITTLIKDILCLSNNDEIIYKIVENKNDQLKINYTKLYNNSRLKSILQINHIWETIFNTTCPKIIINNLISNKINNNNDIVDFLYLNSFKKYITNGSTLSTIKSKINSIESNKESFLYYINKRYNSKISSNDPVFKTLMGTSINFVKSENHIKNPVNGTLISIGECPLYLLEDDILSYSYYYDHSFNRMLHNNLVIYIQGNTSDYIINFLEYCNKVTKNIVILSSENNQTYRKYCIDFYHIKNHRQIEMIHDGIIQTFICIGNNYKIGKFNYIITKDTIHHEPFIIENGRQNVYINYFDEQKENKITLPGFNILIKDDISFFQIKLIIENKIRHLIGVYYLLKFYSLKHTTIIEKVQGEKNDKTLLMIDNRDNPMNIITLDISLKNLDNTWDITFIGSLKSIKYMKIKYGLDINYIQDERLEYNFHIEDYNKILKDINVYKKLLDMGYNKCLIIQDDSAVLKPGLEKSHLFKDFDYIGSPWADIIENKELQNNMCGNGGFSLRNIAKMIETLEKYDDERNELFNNNLQTIPEDVYFAKYVKKTGRIPNYIDALYFGSEQVFTIDSYGFHKIWAYPGDILSYFEHYMIQYYSNFI